MLFFYSLFMRGWNEFYEIYDVIEKKIAHRYGYGFIS